MEAPISSSILHRQIGAPLPRAIRGRGAYLETDDGRHILDASGGAAVSCLGHGHPDVVEAIVTQAQKLAYAHSGFFTSEPAEALADLLVGDRPGGLSRVGFVSGGSEAVEAAIKLARHYFVELGEPRRSRFIARNQSYHGATLGALSAGGNVARRELYEPMLSPVFSHVSAAFPYRGQRSGESTPDYVERLMSEIVAEFERVGPDTVAAFIAEPVVGATAGAVTAPPGYFKRLREICDRYGALLILDEIMCGMGRTGTLHAWQQEGVSPDIQVIAKGLGGGYQPIGAVLVGADIFDAFERSGRAFEHGQTYMAHPIACAAALAVQKVIRRDGLLDAVNALGDRLADGLRATLGDHPHIGDIRGRGLLQAVEIVSDRATKRPFPARLRLHARIKAEALSRGLACYPSGGTADGRNGDHALIAPPFTARGEDIDRIADLLAQSIAAVTTAAAVAAA